MDRAWKDRMLKDPNYAAKRAHAKDAYLSGCFVYCQHNDSWYTPEEFMASNESAEFYRGHERLDKFKIMHPDVGIAQLRDKAQALLEKANELERRKNEYYRNKKR